MFEHPLSNYWLRMALKIIFSNTERKTEIVRTWVISLITSIALETVIKVGLINSSFPELAERTASTNQKDWFYFKIDIRHFGLESEMSGCPILNDIGCIQSLFREFLLFHGITSETIHYVYYNKSFKGHQQTDKYTAIPASWDPPTAVCDRKKKKWNFKDKCNCMNLCSKGDPGLPPPPVRKYITLITSLSIESSNMSHESYLTHNK